MKRDDRERKSSAAPLAVVGIGASAGGLEAIESFFKAAPPDTGLSFVVIQHLSPDHKSLMVELLSRKTAMTVNRAENGMRIQPNQVYLIPPKKNLTIFHGELLLEEQRHDAGINLPVDIFLKSLAEDQGEKAVAVILSGTGSDGTRGIRSIKEAGGLVLVQDEKSAKFDGMPRSAAVTGLADFVLPPAVMPQQIINCLLHPYSSIKQQKNGEPIIDAAATGMTRLFALLRGRTKVDFTYYKPSTIARRIERRIAITQSDDLESYIKHIEENPAEINALHRELLIGVTSFFRDSDVMREMMFKVMPELLRDNEHGELRFWIPGCSTGEEAYTMAIIAREAMEAEGVIRDLKIFATDIDRDAIITAGNGLYPESVAADIENKLLNKYFHRRGESFQIARGIREMVVFAQHNLIRDPPFTRIDLVSCRNLLIYLQSNLQRKALEMFNFSLRPGGVLLLGTSETVGEMEPYFETISRKKKIFRCKGRVLNRALDLHGDPVESVGFRFQGAVRLPRANSTRHRHESMLERLLETVGGAYVPLAVVVNDQMEIVHTIGDTAPFFKIPSGKMSFDIAKMVQKEISIPLVTGVQKAFRTQKEVVYNNVRGGGEAAESFRIRVIPLPTRGGDDPLAVVLFEPKRKPETAAETEEYDFDAETKAKMYEIEQELQFTRENLQATIEELETSNEELQATNEELLASNEELQSTNEELQSTNEELYTVNSEYQSKIIEITEARNDIENLLSGARIGILILDENLNIRHYSPEAADIFNLRDGDIGRPLGHLSHNLIDFDPVKTAKSVVSREKTVERKVNSKKGECYFIRVIPYNIGPRSFSGVVITMVDITAADRDRRELARRELENAESKEK